MVIDCRVQNPKIKTHDNLKKALSENKNDELLKYNMLVNKIMKEQKTVGVAGVLETFLKEKAGPALGLRNLGQIIEFVKARDLVI